MQEQPSVARVALKYGLIAAVASIIYSTILILTENNQNQGLAFLGFIILVVAMVYAMREFRSQNEGFMSYGQGLGIGTLMAGISGLLSSAFTMFYMLFIDPNLMQGALDKTREDMEQRGMSDAQIESAMEMTEKMMSPGILFAMGVFMAILFGFIIALIVSAIMRRNRPVFE